MDRERTIDPRPAETLFRLGAAGGLSDLQLLEWFASRRDEAAESAFGALVDRHGPMVMNVCRGVLRDEHEACDAFQATFLVLAQRAGSLWVRDSLGPWLHRVARRTASSARSAARRRRRREAIAAGRAARSYEDAPDDHREVVHEEVDRLPESQRSPVVLCLLEGLTPEQAAQRLGWPAGTVRSRLARAKVRLKSRLDSPGPPPDRDARDGPSGWARADGPDPRDDRRRDCASRPARRRAWPPPRESRHSCRENCA